jgi:hypothetical protein
VEGFILFVFVVSEGKTVLYFSLMNLRSFFILGFVDVGGHAWFRENTRL